MALQRADSAGPVGFIALADVSWVVGAVVILLIPDTLPTTGKVALVLASLVVLDLGILEWAGCRRLRNG